MIADLTYPIATATGGSAQLRLQPFNSEAFGFISAQLSDMAFGCHAEMDALLAEVNAVAQAAGIRHIVSRVAASDTALKGALQRAGFYYAETSITLSLSGLAERDYSPLAGRVQLAPADKNDIPELARVAGEDFHHGRFLEDPFLDIELARRRHRLWMHELAKTGEVYSARVGERLVGFHVERVLPHGEADLILTGASRQYAMLAPAIWAGALMSLKARGVGHCATLVSAANLGVLNLYQRLGFRFDQTFCGFHRFYD